MQGSHGLDALAFDAPPVDATTLSVRFDQSAHILSSQLAPLQASWLADLPNVEEHPPDVDWLVKPDASAGNVWPLPATTFTSDDGSESVTLQEGLLEVAWVRGSDPYPGYAALVGRLGKHFQELRDAMTTAGIEVTPRSSKCVYRNRLEALSGGDAAVGVLTGWTGTPRADLPAKGYVGVRIHACAGKGHHRCSSYVMVDAGTDDRTELTISVTRKLREGEDSPLGGMQEAHEELLELFLRFTSQEQQEEWGRK